MAKTNAKSTDDGTGERLTLVKGSKLILANGKTKANLDALRKAASELGIDPPKARGGKADQDLMQMVRDALVSEIKNADTDIAVQCVECDEVAIDAMPYCPFCGFEGDISDNNPNEGTPAAPVVAKPEPDEDEPEDSGDDESDAEESDDEGDESDDEDSEDDGDEPDEESDDESEEDESAEEAAAKPEQKPTVGIATKGAAIAKDVPAALAAQADELDTKLRRIDELNRGAHALSYDIGAVCREIRDKQLYRGRGYTSFTQFAAAELPFKRESALRLVSMVEKYTREEYEEIGYSKLRLIGAVDDNIELKEELIAEVRAGANTRQLAEKIKGAAAPEVDVRPPQTAPEKEKADKITLIGRIGGRKQIAHFYDKAGGSLPTLGTVKLDRPDGYAELEVSEGVFLRVSLKLNKASELTGVAVQFVRAEIEA